MQATLGAWCQCERYDTREAASAERCRSGRQIGRCTTPEHIGGIARSCEGEISLGRTSQVRNSDANLCCLTWRQGATRLRERYPVNAAAGCRPVQIRLGALAAAQRHHTCPACTRIIGAVRISGDSETARAGCKCWWGRWPIDNNHCDCYLGTSAIRGYRKRGRVVSCCEAGSIRSYLNDTR